MRHVVLCLAGVLALAIPAVGSESSAPPGGLCLVYATTQSAVSPPVIELHLLEAKSRARQPLYRDPEEGNRILVKIASSDIVGAGRAVPPSSVYVMMGPALAGLCPDAMCRLRISQSAKLYDPEPLFPVPLCFSDASPYGMWNRAPTFAVSRDGGRFAISALRAGEIRFDRPTIRILSGAGEELWQIALDDQLLYVADLAWSPDGGSLAYLVMPQGDAHTLDDAPLPLAGLYVADTAARSTRMVRHCFADALAWGPTPGRITVAERQGGVWGSRHVGRVLSLPSGKKVEEFSLRGHVSALHYSADSRWLAVQTMIEDRQQIWLYPRAGGWGRPLLELSPGEGRLSLLGWVRVSPGVLGE